MGIGIGAKNATVPIFSAEMAPARIRGALVMFWQLWVVIGMCFRHQEYALVRVANPICRYFPGFLRQRHRKGYRKNRLAPSTRVSFHPIIRSRNWHLLLP